MIGPTGSAVAGWLVLAMADGRGPPPERPAASVIETACRQEVERKFPPGSLSRRQNERQRLVEACIANGGRLP